MQENKVRYGVVGLGWIAQVAVLPAFKHAHSNSELVALFSGDSEKRNKVGRKYKVPAYPYEEYQRVLRSGELDAVYVASPNFMHYEHTVIAAREGVHVLCEKPMAVTVRECEAMIYACRENAVKLMIAYRLHFEEANLKAIEIVQSGKLGSPRIFNSVFTMEVTDGNIRLEEGGGPVLDLGIYCINAARYLFQQEPIEVMAFAASGRDARFDYVEEMMSAILRFPDERLANFTCSFGAADNSFYEVVGTKGTLCIDPAYEYATELKHYLTIGEKTKEKTFKKRDQFAPELLYFSECILEDKEPEPSGAEGLNDVRIIEALYQSAREQRSIPLSLQEKEFATPNQEIHRPPISKPDLVRVQQPAA